MTDVHAVAGVGDTARFLIHDTGGSMPPAQTSTAPALGGSRWNTFPAVGTMTARQFFAGAEPLLQGVIDDNALQSVDGEVLEAQIHATLGLGTRETSLPLAIGP